MALYVAPQLAQQQVQMRVQPTHTHQHKTFSAPRSDSSSFLNRGHSCADHESDTLKSSEPSEECLTVDLSQASTIHFAKWNGTNCSILESQTISPTSIGVSDDYNLEDVSFPIKDTSNIISGQDALSKCNEKNRFSPLSIFQEIALLTCDKVDNKKDIIIINSLAILLTYCMNIGYPNSISDNISSTTTIKKSKSKSKTMKNVIKTLTIIIPSSETSTAVACQYLIKAAKLANISIKNIFTQDIAYISYLYHHHILANSYASSQLSISDTKRRKALLFLQSSSDFYALVFSLNSSKDINDKTGILTISLVECEVSTATSVMERMVTIATKQIVDFPMTITTGIDVKEEDIEELLKAAGTTNSIITRESIKGIVYNDDVINNDSKCLKSIQKMFPTLPSSSYLTISMTATMTTETANTVGGNELSRDPRTAKTTTTTTTVSVSPAALGGCLLSAAELESSKEYIKRDDGSWAIVYQLPVGDGYFKGEIGLLTCNSAIATKTTSHMKKNDENEVQVLFTQTKVSKLEHGVLRPLKGVAATWNKEYVRKHQDASYPRLTLMHRQSPSAEWLPLQTIYPLSTDITTTKSSQQQQLQLQCVKSCQLKLSINPHTNTVTVDMKQGQSSSDMKVSRTFWWQVLLVIFAILFVPMSYYGYNMYQTYSLTTRHEKWLRNFYEIHSPEKLKQDPTYVAKTILKYKGRMFLLWRNLEKQYKVKLEPPDDIIE